MALVVALATTGIGYGLWSDTLFIRGDITTGTVSAAFDRAFTDDDGRVDDALRDSMDVGDCPIQAGGNSSCDPAASGADPKPHHDKDVGLCVAEVVNPDLGLITQKNVYPGYFCTAWFGVHNDGSVPVRIAEAKVNGAAVIPGASTPYDLDGDGADDVAIHLTGIDVCQQIDPGDTVLMDVDQEILMGASQDVGLNYTIEVTLQQWNAECAPTELPTFTVATAGISPTQAVQLAEAFGVPSDLMVVEDGGAFFVNPAEFQAVPMQPVEFDPADEDNRQLKLEGFDFDAIAEMVALSGDEALDKTNRGLVATKLMPANAEPFVQNSFFEAVSPRGELLLPRTAIDTEVRFAFELNGIPLLGPFAQVAMTYAPDGAMTAMTYAAYGLAQAEPVPVIPPTDAARKCAELYPGLQTNLSPTLAYWAPPSLGEGAAVLPHYDCQGTAVAGRDTTNLLQALIPAVADSALAPQVELAVETDGPLVIGEAFATGGTPPYTYGWNSSTTDLSDVPEDQSNVEYNVFGREADTKETTETLGVLVTDANGIVAMASETVVVNPIPPGPALVGRVGGVVDFGIERAVSDMCANNVNRYSARMDNEAFKRFHWTGQNAWEIDFKGSSAHDAMVDNVDEAFYCGHGWGGGFTFESNVNDGSIVPADPQQTAGGDWGDKDLEWLALLSCQVLRGESGGQQWYQRWGPAFDGLHLLLGFETNAYDWSNFGKRFAQWQQGYSIFNIVVPVRAAWFQAAQQEQPSGVKAVVMGVIGPSGLSNYNDYFHGNGPVGPDIRGSNIHGYWRVVKTVS